MVRAQQNGSDQDGVAYAKYPRASPNTDEAAMRAYELTTGRTFAVNFEHGEDFFDALREFCTTHGVKQGYIPMFIAGFFEVDLVGACDKLEDPKAPVWSKVHLANAEAIGCGTIAWDEDNDVIVPHIHTSVGLKEQSANGFTSHLLAAKVQFLVEMMIVEIATPSMSRPRDADMYDVPLLKFS